MKVPTLQGMIDRRILANYRIDPDIAARQLPPPFWPQLANGYAIAGICLIRLKQIRPACVSVPVGIGSENAAHRFAVEWEQNGGREQGVFIPRRDTDSCLNALVGGTLFPGEHHRAHFDVAESADRFHVSCRSEDGQSHVNLDAGLAAALPAGSIFASLDEASRFFESGATGYSATQDPGRFDGLELRCRSWSVQPLAVTRIRSSYFDDPARFPPGSIVFDCALLMRQIDHEWHARNALCCGMSTPVR